MNNLAGGVKAARHDLQRLPGGQAGVPALMAAAVVALALAGTPVMVFASGQSAHASAQAGAQQPDHSQPSTEQAAPGVAAEPSEHAEEEEHHSVWAGLLWPTVNFAILFGGLWYFLKSPLADYLRDRHSAIRKELVEAANVTSTASAQLAEIEKKLHALPGDIDALRRRGAEEIAAEEVRIANLAAAERERLLEQTRREIDLQLRLAKRELVEHAADLAVTLAGDRIQKQITPADQERLVDRYLKDVGTSR